jgi:hypothetical protein
MAGSTQLCSPCLPSLDTRCCQFEAWQFVDWRPTLQNLCQLGTVTLDRTQIVGKYVVCLHGIDISKSTTLQDLLEVWLIVIAKPINSV